MGPWRISVLGGLRAVAGVQEVSRFSTLKVAGLLAYLACHPERSHLRDALVELFWPETDPACGRRSLRVALTSLRATLEPPGTPAGAVLLADRDAVRLNPAGFATDVAAFQEHLRRAAAARPSAEQVHELEQAVRLYAGELLPGFYDDWVCLERIRLAGLYVSAQQKLAEQHERAGDLSRALECLRDLLREDPFREQTHYSLIRVLAAAGEISAALRQYETLEQLLREELGVEPSLETRLLVRDLSAPRTGAPVSELPRGKSRPASGARTETLTVLVVDVSPFAAGHGFPDAELRELGGQVERLAGERARVLFSGANSALSGVLRLWSSADGADGSGSSLPLRAALDVGEVVREGDRCRGDVLQRAERLLRGAHPGQLLCSETAASLLLADASVEAGERAQLADLGRYCVEERGRAERVFQIVPPTASPRDLPPPDLPPALSGSLPLQATCFVGRERELAHLREQLLPLSSEEVDDDTGETSRSLCRCRPAPLVTLTGPGGSGKTRTSLALADRLRPELDEAIWFVSLADTFDPARIWEGIAAEIHLPRSPHTTPREQVLRALHGQRGLLILDNFEQLVDQGAAVVRELSEQVPTLSLLITSRRRLNLAVEKELVLGPLAVPGAGEPLEQVARTESVQLFVDRARRVRPGLQLTRSNAAAVAQLCARLEGLPLALELAAARAGVLTPAQILAQLERPLDVLVSRRRDTPERHRSLKAAIDWSYRLLSSEARRFFNRLAVFRGGFTLEAAAAVAADPPVGGSETATDCLEQLQEASLVQVHDEGSGLRFSLLETIREFAEQQLEAEEYPASPGRDDREPSEHQWTARRHLEYFTSLAARAAEALKGAEQRVWLDQLEREAGNFRAALRWAVQHDPETALTLCRYLGRFWHVRGYYAEGLAWSEAALSRCPACDVPARPYTLLVAAAMARGLGEQARAMAQAEEALSAFRGRGDEAGIAAGLYLVAVCRSELGECAEPLALQREALDIRRRIGDHWGAAQCLAHLASTSYACGDYPAARAYCVESLDIFRTLHDPLYIAVNLGLRGLLAKQAGDLQAARALLEEALAIHRSLDSKRDGAWVRLNLSAIYLESGDLKQAVEMAREALRAARQLGDRVCAAECLDSLAYLAAAAGETRKAVLLAATVYALHQDALGNAPAGARVLARLAPLRARLGEAAFHSAWEAGQRLSWEEAAALACADRTWAGMTFSSTSPCSWAR